MTLAAKKLCRSRALNDRTPSHNVCQRSRVQQWRATIRDPWSTEEDHASTMEEMTLLNDSESGSCVSEPRNRRWMLQDEPLTFTDGDSDCSLTVFEENFPSMSDTKMEEVDDDYSSHG